jgi:hypothetical protein
VSGSKYGTTTQWVPPVRPPKQPPPARMEPLPLTVTGRDISAPGAPIYITDEGVEYVERLAAVGASDTAIAGALRIDRQTFRHCRRRQPEVDEALAKGRAALGTELSHHLLLAARNNDWQAALALGRFRLGWGNQAVSSQPGEDLPEPEAKRNVEIDWSKVPAGECAFLHLALCRLGDLQPEPGDRPLTDSERRLLALHAALHDNEIANRPGVPERVLALLTMRPLPSIQELEQLRAAPVRTHAERMLVRIAKAKAH